MPSYNRWVEYGFGAGLVFIILLASFIWSDPFPLMLAKAATAPLFYLANRGIRLTFVSEASRTPWTFPYIERHALFALVWACFWIIVSWQENMTAQRAVGVFVFMLVAWLVVIVSIDLVTNRHKRR